MSNYNLDDENLEQIEEDIIKAADKAGKKNVVVNIFTYPHKKLKKRWDIRYKFNKKHLVMDLLIALGVFVLIGLNLFWFTGGSHYFFNKFELSIDKHFDQAVSGQTTEFVIHYENNNKYEMEDVWLSLKLPKLFQLESVSAENYDYQHNLLSLGDLQAGANGEIKVTGKIVGAIDDKQLFYANCIYFKTDKKGDRLWGQFNKMAYTEYEIQDSLLKMQLQIPDKVVKGQVFDWQVKLENSSQDITYEKVTIYPNFNQDNFIAIDYQDLVVDNFEPGQTQEFSGKARVITQAETFPLFFEANWQQGFDIVQARYEKNQTIIRPQFSLTQVLTPSYVVTPGQWVDYELNYKNNGQYTIENVKLNLQLIGQYWDLTQVELPLGKLSENVISWTQSDIPRLQLLQPGEGGTVNFKVKTKNFVANSQSLGLSSQTFLNYTIEDNDVLIMGEKKNLQLNSNLSVQAYPVYYTSSGDQLGRGALPPKVGEQNKYWVFIKIINDINDVSTVNVSAQLPSNVTWLDKSNVPIGNAIEYDADSRFISWDISRVPAEANNFGFAFEIAITPTQDQVGNYPLLLQNIKISGVDNKTEKIITKNLGSITTKLNQSDRGSLRDGGVVSR